jgi:hypothetical protein
MYKIKIGGKKTKDSCARLYLYIGLTLSVSLYYHTFHSFSIHNVYKYNYKYLFK